jgi:hypothetical protein
VDQRGSIPLEKSASWRCPPCAGMRQECATRAMGWVPTANIVQLPAGESDPKNRPGELTSRKSVMAVSYSCGRTGAQLDSPVVRIEVRACLGNASETSGTLSSVDKNSGDAMAGSMQREQR